ncbi:MAG: cytochrome c3 family protein [Candidatus Krumholzibacteriia bacterium]
MAPDKTADAPGGPARDDRGPDSVPPTARFLFPRWTNRLRGLSAAVVVGGIVYAVVFFTLLFDPDTTAVGYAPEQPVPYSHALHVGELGMDCRYCHSTVEESPHASIPPTQTCMNCHRLIRAESPQLLPVRQSDATGMPVAWVRVHDLPDFVYFDHSAHVNVGVSCVECHGRVDKMEVVQQAAGLNMAWCLDCHRRPDARLRPVEFVTQLDWEPLENPVQLGGRLRQALAIDPSTDCTTCHR